MEVDILCNAQQTLKGTQWQKSNVSCAFFSYKYRIAKMLEHGLEFAHFISCISARPTAVATTATAKVEMPSQ